MTAQIEVLDPLVITQTRRYVFTLPEVCPECGKSGVECYRGDGCGEVEMMLDQWLEDGEYEMEVVDEDTAPDWEQGDRELRLLVDGKVVED